MGGVHQLLHPLAGAGSDGDDRHTQLLGQPVHVDPVPPLFHLVHEVEGHHRGPLQLQQLDGEVQVALQIGGVHNVDDAVGGRADDKVPGHNLLHGVGGQGVDAGQVHHRHRPVTDAGLPLLLLHRHAGPVAHILVGAGESVEQGGLAAVGVAGQSDAHGAPVVLGRVVAPAVLLQLVLVGPELTAGGLRVGTGHSMEGGAAARVGAAQAFSGAAPGRAGTPGPGLAHDNLGGVRLAQGELIPPQ